MQKIYKSGLTAVTVVLGIRGCKKNSFSHKNKSNVRSSSNINNFVILYIMSMIEASQSEILKCTESSIYKTNVIITHSIVLSLSN